MFGDQWLGTKRHFQKLTIDTQNDAICEAGDKAYIGE